MVVLGRCSRRIVTAYRGRSKLRRRTSRPGDRLKLSFGSSGDTCYRLGFLTPGQGQLSENVQLPHQFGVKTMFAVRKKSFLALHHCLKQNAMPPELMKMAKGLFCIADMQVTIIGLVLQI